HADEPNTDRQMAARIDKPAKTAMQSGRALTRAWVLEFEPAERKTNDPLMGWVGSGDTEQQVRLFFDTKEEAIAYCRRHRIDCEVHEPKERTVRPKSYASNFRSDRVSYGLVSRLSARSSADQSNSLLSCGSQVRVLPGAPNLSIGYYATWSLLTSEPGAWVTDRVTLSRFLGFS